MSSLLNIMVLVIIDCYENFLEGTGQFLSQTLNEQRVCVCVFVWCVFTAFAGVHGFRSPPQ